MEQKDKVVFNALSNAMGVPLPEESLSAFLPAGGLFTKGWMVLIGIGILFAVAWLGRKEPVDPEERQGLG